MSELILSASSVEAYASCHYRWYLGYIESSQGEQGIPQAVGLGVHAAVEDYYNARLAGDRLSPEEVLAAGQNSFDLTFGFESAEISDPSEDPATARKEGRRVTAAYLTNVGPFVEPVLVEHAGRIVVNGIEYSFQLDLADADRKVRDTKVKRSKPRYGMKTYLFQGIGYALGYREWSGSTESDFQLDIMIRLKRDPPYHFPLSHGGPFSDFEIAEFADRLERIANGIAQGKFEPTGLDEDPSPCPYCPVRSICEPYAETHPEA